MIKKYIKIYFLYIAQYFKMRFIYRKDFIINILLELISKISTLLFISIIFIHIPQLNGWSMSEILIIYALCLIVRGIFLTFFSRIEDLGSDFIIDGNLDRLLTRPLNPLFLLIADRINESQITESLIGLCSLIFALTTLKIHITFKLVLLIVFSVINGVFIYLGFFLIINSLSFWFNSRFSLMWTFMELSEYAQYPITIFSKPVQFILTWIVPFGLTSYFPATLILNRFGGVRYIAYVSPLVTLGFLLIGYTVWKLGLLKYESVGS